MSERVRILLIDDDETIRKSISKALQKAGYKVDAAENGKEALEKAETNFYNLALIDIHLPDMEGTKLLTAIRESTPKMIKIILTGYPALENAIESVNRGADAYIRKPVDINELLKVIKHHLGKQSKENQFGEEKVSDFVLTRLKRLETEDKDKGKS